MISKQQRQRLIARLERLEKKCRHNAESAKLIRDPVHEQEWLQHADAVRMAIADLTETNGPNVRGIGRFHVKS